LRKTPGIPVITNRGIVIAGRRRRRGRVFLTGAVRVVPVVTVGLTLFFRFKIRTKTIWTKIICTVRVGTIIIERFTEIATATDVIVTF